MHYLCKVILPPTIDVHSDISKVMAPFNENRSGDEDDVHFATKHGFWDWWEIGGRWGAGGSRNFVKNIESADTCHTLLVAGPSYDSSTGKLDGPIACTFLLHRELWNGVVHQTSLWDGTILDGFRLMSDRLIHCKPEYRDAVTPLDDWLVVTVDYHG